MTMWDWQLILVYITLALAVVYLLRKYVWNPQKKGADGDCGKPDCGCS